MSGGPNSDAAVAFCDAVFVWIAENRPDARNIDEELMEMMDE